MKRILILGAGRHAVEVYEWLVADSGYEMAGFFSEPEFLGQKELVGFPVYTDLTNLSGLHFVVGVGDPLLKSKLTEMALSSGLEPSNPLIHKTAIVSSRSILSKGVVIFPNCVVSIGVKLAEHCCLNASVSISHDTSIGAFTSLGPGAVVAGGVDVSTHVNIGAGATIKNGVAIAHGITIGLGAAVVSSLSEQATYVGVPAKNLRK